MIFASYAATGLLFLLLGLLAAFLLPGLQGLALLLVGGIGGVYALTAASIYDPGAELRLHALAEAAFSGALLQAALVFPRPWRHPVAPAIALGWFASLALAAAYQLVLFEPGAYSAMHACAEAMLGASGVLLATRLVWELASAMRRAGPLLRWSSLGAAVGLGVPAVVVGVSGLSGGQVPVNYVVTAAFAFPLCTCIGLLREPSPTGYAAAAVKPTGS